MSMDFIAIGPVPADEACAQVGQADYHERSAIECRVFKRMLERIFPAADGLRAYVIVKSFPHDFGTYREVCVKYDPNDAAAAAYALHVEDDAPAQWDVTARYELDWYPHKAAYMAALQTGKIQVEDIPAEYRSIEPPELDANIVDPPLPASPDHGTSGLTTHGEG